MRPLTYGPIVVDTRTAHRVGRRRAVTLTAKEFLLLEYLLRIAAACCRAMCC